VAIVVPILSEWNPKGLNRAMADFRRAEGAFGKLDHAVSKYLTPSLFAATAAAGALAVKLGVDAVQAAADDERAMMSLARTMENLGYGARGAEVEAYIGKLQKLYGVADNDLRAAFDRLLRATNDVGEAQKALALSVDAAAGSGKSLESVANALGRAYEGSTTALGRLGLGLDKATLASGNLDVITAAMARTFDGQAATAASSLSGQLNLLRTRTDEAVEALGYDLVEAIDRLSGGTGSGLDSAASLVEKLTATTGDLIVGMSLVVDELRDLIPRLEDSGEATESAADAQTSWTDSLRAWNPMVATGLDLLQRFAIASDETEAVMYDAAAATSAWSSRLAGLANVLTAARAAQSYAANNAASSARWTALAVQDFDASIRYAGGNLSEYFASLDDVGGGGGSTASTGGATGAVTEATSKAERAFDRLANRARATAAALAAAADEQKAARDAFDEYATTVSDWLTGSTGLAAALQAEAATAGAEHATTYLAAWLDSMENTRKAQDAINHLLSTLDPTNVAGNEALVGQLLTLPPGEAARVADDLVTRGLGPEMARRLGEYDLWAAGVGAKWAETFRGPAVAAADAQYDALSTTLEGYLPELYQLGRKLGKEVMRGYESIVSGLPAGITRPGGGGSGGASTRSAAPVVNVNVTAGHGDPIAIARAVEATMRTAARRLGR
jgi:hypothetical protein